MSTLEISDENIEGDDRMLQGRANHTFRQANAGKLRIIFIIYYVPAQKSISVLS